MSHAYGAVRFSDGVVLFFEYNGTGDVCLPKLWETYEEVRGHWREENPFKKCTCGRAPERVDAFNDYADGAYWKTTACRHCRVVIDCRGPWEADEEFVKDGYPDWVQATFLANIGD